MFMTGKKSRPRTEPIYSGGKLIDYPITTGYDVTNYTDLISSYTINTQSVLISQSMLDGYFYGIFAPSKLLSTVWGKRKDFVSFGQFVEEEWQWVNGKSNMIYSLAYDRCVGLGVFFTENFGTTQLVLYNISISEIQEKWNKGYHITACVGTADIVGVCIVMTKDAEEYKGKTQAWFACSTWEEACLTITQYYKERFIITGICYSERELQYFVVMTQSPEVQSSKWFDINGFGPTSWIDKKDKEGFHPTIIFADPVLKKTLLVVTTGRCHNNYRHCSNRSSYRCIWHKYIGSLNFSDETELPLSQKLMFYNPKKPRGARSDGVFTHA